MNLLHYSKKKKALRIITSAAIHVTLQTSDYYSTQRNLSREKVENDIFWGKQFFGEIGRQRGWDICKF
jgi:hypothetical protein